ncbi:type II toxin-antitoxin system VapC family toxin [Microbacterium sp. 2FI]|uniref:type II toxin-antitoxin system VapC family toxin n=1 Tax=Microbacterium sp. 2FI TaxID=2502193 RepID=UPI0010F8F67A|nr:type II toxin-antitoxin system VapC family toxin [Microbacterium sp. 2FI]
MIVDTSALVAILKREAGHEQVLDALLSDDASISAATLVETRVVVGSTLGVAGRRRLESLLTQAAVRVVAFDEEQAQVAADAYRDFGRGATHPAKLNLGDTFSYALAFISGEPLLYVGNDFARTDLRSALEEFDT